MDKKKPSKQHPDADSTGDTNESPERRSKARRRLLQSMAAGSAAVTVKTLPER